jgi:hypothetical protein
MACACGSKSSKSTKYTVSYSNGKTYKVYGTKVEADAAALRIGGKVKAS